MVINKMDSIFSTFLTLRICFLIWLVLETQPSNEFDRRNFFIKKFNRVNGNLKGTLISVRSSGFPVAEINVAERYNGRSRLDKRSCIMSKDDIYDICREGQESMYTRFDCLILLCTVNSSNICFDLHRV